MVYVNSPLILGDIRYLSGRANVITFRSVSEPRLLALEKPQQSSNIPGEEVPCVEDGGHDN